MHLTLIVLVLIPSQRGLLSNSEEEPEAAERERHSSCLPFVIRSLFPLPAAEVSCFCRMWLPRKRKKEIWKAGQTTTVLECINARQRERKKESANI